jgi:all-trans-retinol 13,14-reductase
VEDVSSIFPGGVIYEFLSDLGINIGNLFYKNSSTYHLSDGRVISERFSEKEFQQKLIEFFPNEKENIKQFFESAYKAYSQAMQGVKEYGTPLPVDIQSLIYDKKQFLEKILTHPIENPEIHLWMSSTYEEILNRFFKDPILKEFFSVRLPFTGTQLKDTDGLLALTAIVSFNLHFGHSIKGGAQAYSDSLVEYIRNHGGTVILSTPVEKVLIEDGKAKGLVTKDKIFRADAVISNVDAINTFTKLIPEGLTSKKYIRNIVNSKMSPSLLMVSLGLNMDLRDKTSLIRASGKNKIGIQILNHAGENFAPKNKSAICILSMDIIEGKEFPDRKSESYKDFKQTLGDEIVQRAEKFLPGLSKSIEVMDIATPKTFERYTGMPGGALYSFYQGNKTKRPYFKTPIPGLYLASASTFPGGGVEAVTISGIIAAMDILNWKKRNSNRAEK